MELEELGVPLESRMKKFILLLLAFVFLGFVSAEVNEYNYFKLGELDSSGSLIKMSDSVSGVSVMGFICSDVDCSGSLGNLWGGELYTSGSGMNLVYPTILQSSYGYGFWVYKTGYVPYWVKGVTWYGIGTVSSVDRYLAKKQSCVSDVSVVDIEQVDGELFVDVRVDSPIVDKYGSMYVPSGVASYLDVLIDVGVEVRDDGGQLVWSDEKQKSVGYSDNAVVSFTNEFDDGRYTFSVSTSLYNEPQCLSSSSGVDSFDFVVDTYDDDKDDDGYSEDVDCDDNDASVWRILNGYVDSDGDGYGVDPIVGVCSGVSLLAGYVFDNNDCDDSDANVNPGEVEVCYDGVDNDCDGEVDENCDLVPSVVLSANPLSGIFPLDVEFNCQGIGGDGELTYFWSFGDGDTTVEQNPSHTYVAPGDFSASCTVTDEDGDIAFGSVLIEVGPQTLDISDIICFNNVVEGHNQSCSVYVEDNLGNPAGQINVNVYYSDGSLFGSCVSDGISGACAVKDLQASIGDWQVYAVASRANYIPDDDTYPRFDYTVFEEEYDIVNLKVYNDVSYSEEDYDFYRGENLYVSFGVEKSDGSPAEAGLVSGVSLVSSFGGGRVELEQVSFSGSYYYYKLIPIPVTHDFLGDSNVFAFVFNITGQSGGQEEVSLVIRNNLPVISPSILAQSGEKGELLQVDLSLHENDVEDSGADLIWEVISFSNLDVNLVGKLLFIKGNTAGEEEVVVRLIDLDGDYDEQVVDVSIESSSFRGSDSDCDSNWVCSAWNDCEDGIQIRSCEDINCGDVFGGPEDFRICSEGSGFLTSSDGVVYLNDLLEKEAEGYGFLVWSLIILIIGLLILITVFLIKRL